MINTKLKLSERIVRNVIFQAEGRYPTDKMQVVINPDHRWDLKEAILKLVIFDRQMEGTEIVFNYEVAKGLQALFNKAFDYLESGRELDN